MTQKQPAILIYVGMDLVGDALMKLPFIRAVRQAWPDAEIVWLAGKGESAFAGSLAPLVEGLIDQVVDDAKIGTNFSELLGKPLKDTPLAGRTFDIILDTQRRFLTTLILKKIPHQHFISGAAGFLLSSKKPAHPQNKPRSMVGAMMQLIEAANGSVPAVSDGLRLDPVFDYVAEKLLPSGRIYIGLAPGAGGKHKCWPLDNYLALANQLAEQGIVPVVFLGPGEADWADTVRAKAPKALLPLQTDEATKYAGSPLLTIALGKRLKAAVANDAGVGHMLAASDVPLISLFGPTPPEKFAPFIKQGAIIKAQDFGDSSAMENIPIEAMKSALAPFLD